MTNSPRIESIDFLRWALLIACVLEFLTGLVLLVWGAVNGRLVAPIASLLLVAFFLVASAFVWMGLASSFSREIGDLLFKARRDK